MERIIENPRNSCNSKACILNNDILVTGYYYTNGLCSYDDNADRYRLVNANIEGVIKHVMHGWIITDAGKMKEGKK
jgi:hypothetical protein